MAQRRLNSTGTMMTKKKEQPPIVVTAEEYTEHNYIIYNGKLKRISRSSAYLLDMLSKSEE